ncbi:hypothetical protein RRG08_022061 [Elysia crispata]|uniref:Uncharacterized protein n=1 Tax=Elysia crispata TaxID=231223 RepID=A0AAE0Y1W9_9GAST|nr:hypothetical protein RRG08_022061 [Elysia crispata]
MAIFTLLLLFVLSLIYCVYGAPISFLSNADGFTLSNLEPRKYFSYGVTPKVLGQNMTLTFYDVKTSTHDCDDLSVEIQNNGYFKNDYNRVAIMCFPESIETYTLSSTRGFHVVIRTGKDPLTGQISARFTVPSASGIHVTNQLLYSI